MTTSINSGPLVDALKKLCERVEKKHPHARVAVHDAWWKKVENVSATFFGNKSQDGAEVVLSAKGSDGVEGELYVERSLVAASSGGALSDGAKAAIDSFLQRCEREIDAHLTKR